MELRWVKNNVEGSKFAFGPGRFTPELTYLGAPIFSDFELSYETLAPYVTKVLDLVAPLEGAGLKSGLLRSRTGLSKSGDQSA